MAVVEKNKNELVAALAEARKTFKPIKKTRSNPRFVGTSYADLDDVLEAVTESLTANQLEILGPLEVSEDGQTILVVKLIHYPSAQEEISRYPLPKTDNPQVMGSNLTYGRRYLISSLLNVVADKDDDGNAASLPPNPQPKSLPKSATAKPAPKPVVKPVVDEDPSNPEMGQQGYQSLLTQLKTLTAAGDKVAILTTIVEKLGLDVGDKWVSFEHPEAYVLKCALGSKGVVFDKAANSATGLTMHIVESFDLMFTEIELTS